MIGDILGIIAAICGAFFLLVGSVGLVRLPDFYTRNHATGKSHPLGIMLVIVGLMLIEGFSLNSAKLFFALIFVFLTNPTGTHALINAALNSGLKPWFKKDMAEGDRCLFRGVNFSNRKKELRLKIVNYLLLIVFVALLIYASSGLPNRGDVDATMHREKSPAGSPGDSSYYIR